MTLEGWDVDELLTEIRHQVRVALETAHNDDLAGLIDELDNHLSSGGVLPTEWEEARWHRPRPPQKPIQDLPPL